MNICVCVILPVYGIFILTELSDSNDNVITIASINCFLNVLKILIFK